MSRHRDRHPRSGSGSGAVVFAVSDDGERRRLDENRVEVTFGDGTSLFIKVHPSIESAVTVISSATRSGGALDEALSACLVVQPGAANVVTVAVRSVARGGDSFDCLQRS